MERQHKITQIYGYAVCLVTVITSLIAVASLVDAAFNLSNPLHATGYYDGVNLASFEAYRMDVQRSPRRRVEEISAPGYLPDEETLREMYKTARTDRIASVRFRSFRSLTTQVILLVLCTVFFATHFSWMRRLARQ